MCRHTNQGIWRGLGGAGGPFWLHRVTLTFKVPAAYQNTMVFHTYSSKIQHTVCDVFISRSAIQRTHCTTSLEVVQH